MGQLFEAASSDRGRAAIATAGFVRRDKVSWMEGILSQTYGSGFSCTRYGSGTNAHMKCY